MFTNPAFLELQPVEVRGCTRNESSGMAVLMCRALLRQVISIVLQARQISEIMFPLRTAELLGAAWPSESFGKIQLFGLTVSAELVT